MRVQPTPLDGAWVIDLMPRSDARGFFSRVFCEEVYSEYGMNPHIAQINLSRSEQTGTLRGFHYQIHPHEEAKTVRCVKGRILDVIIDLRPESATRLHHFSTELSESNRRALYVPEGMAHAFLTLEPQCEVLYTVSTPYAPTSERGIRWDDPVFKIQWPVSQPILSEKDAGWLDFSG